MEEIEAEEEVFTEVVYSRTEQRSRHLSDCIDSVGETENFSMHRHSFSDFSGKFLIITIFYGYSSLFMFFALCTSVKINVSAKNIISVDLSNYQYSSR